jgi:NAD(P)-dependent dehydrogenase (short-subunit alcohol dehydrogenase family)
MAADLFALNDQVALVTGASSGLGEHFARALAEHGAKVVVGARRRERLETLVSGIEANDGTALAVDLDVTDADSVRQAFDTVEKTFGTVSILVNNAGLTRSEFFLKTTEDDWNAVMDTNLTGAWRVAQEAAKRMVAAKVAGSIVNIASIIAFATQTKESTYGVSKAAIAHLTRSMANELMRYGIRVNALAPGYFLTEMNEAFFATDKGREYIEKGIPAKRLGKPEELTGPLLLLASDAGSFINGAVLPVDGGHLVGGR